MSAPPRWLLRLVARAAPASIREDVLGDLEERWQQDLRRSRAYAFRRCLALSVALCWHSRREKSTMPQPPFRFASGLLAQPVLVAWRQAVRQPLSTALAVLTLGLGIGATTALFSVVNAWLLRPLPFHDPGRLVVVWETIPSAGVLENTPAPASFAAWQEQAASFDGLAAWTLLTANLTGDGDPARLDAVAASPDLLPVLGIHPALGRNFEPNEARAGAGDVVMLSNAFWRSRFGAAPDILGRHITLDGRSVRIIGVLPEPLPLLGFSFDVWRPLILNPLSESRMLWVFGRLRPGVTLDQATDEVSRIGSSRAGSGMTARVTSLHDQTVGTIGQDVLVLFAATAIVLLIACANVASLTLARLSARRREFHVVLRDGR